MADIFQHQVMMQRQAERRAFIKEHQLSFTLEQYKTMFGVSIKTIKNDAKAIGMNLNVQSYKQNERLEYIRKNPEETKAELATRFKVSKKTIEADLHIIKYGKNHKGKVRDESKSTLASGSATWKKTYSKVQIDRFVMNCF